MTTCTCKITDKTRREQQQATKKIQDWNFPINSEQPYIFPILTPVFELYTIRQYFEFSCFIFKGDANMEQKHPCNWKWISFGREEKEKPFMLLEITLTIDHWWFWLNCLLLSIFFLSLYHRLESQLFILFATFINIGTKMNWSRHMVESTIGRYYVHNVSNTQIHIPSFTVEIQVSMFHFRHKITVANVLFGHNFSYFLLNFVWFLHWFLFYLADDLCFLFDTNNSSSNSNNKRYSFLTLQWGWGRNLFTCAIFKVIFFSFFDFFCCFSLVFRLLHYLYIFPIASLEKIRMFCICDFISTLVSEPIALFMHYNILQVFVQISLAFRWCPIRNSMHTKIW